MNKLYNELGISLVNGSGNWIGISYEIEDSNGNEVRKWGWKKLDYKNIIGIYGRFWFYKKVLVISNKGLKIQNKNKIGIKIIFGIESNYINN